jgi:hypothetical protein
MIRSTWNSLYVWNCGRTPLSDEHMLQFWNRLIEKERKNLLRIKCAALLLGWDPDWFATLISGNNTPLWLRAGKHCNGYPFAAQWARRTKANHIAVACHSWANLIWMWSGRYGDPTWRLGWPRPNKSGGWICSHVSCVAHWGSKKHK